MSSRATASPSLTSIATTNYRICHQSVVATLEIEPSSSHCVTMTRGIKGGISFFVKRLLPSLAKVIVTSPLPAIVIGIDNLSSLLPRRVARGMLKKFVLVGICE